MPEITCNCGETFDPSDSIGSDLGLCQDCWETESSEQWWEMLGALYPVLVAEEEEPRDG